MGKGFPGSLSSQDILCKVGEGTHMHFLLPFSNQNVFRNTQQRSGVFLSLDLRKAIKDTGKARGPSEPS